ncbi:hypothetical protein [Maritalea sp.]|jgi:IS30 family transposase
MSVFRATDTLISIALPRALNVKTPRKCLGWKTLAEMFKEKMLEETKF